MLCCFQPDGLSTLQTVGPQCASMARATADLGADAKAKGERAVEYTNEVTTLLRTIGSGGLSASTFRGVQSLIEKKDSLKFVTEIDDVATEMVGKTEELTKSLQDSVNSMPKTLTEDVESEESEGETTRDMDGGEEAMGLARFLETADEDVDDVDVQARGMMDDVDIFTVSQRGRDAFEKVGNTEKIAVKIFNEIKSVASTIAEVVVAFTTGGCCAQFEALASGFRNLLKCLSLSKLIQKALAFVKRLLKAAMEFLQMAWDKFSGFLEQFDAAKKLERFTGQAKANVMSKLGGIGLGQFVQNSAEGGGMLDSLTGNATVDNFVKNTAGMLMPQDGEQQQKSEEDRPTNDESALVLEEASSVDNALSGVNCCGVLSTMPKIQ